MQNAVKALKFAGVSLIAFAVSASGFSGSGMVLCIGSDGHLALEMAHQGRCNDAADDHGHEQEATDQVLKSADTDCCGDCVDVALTMDSMSRPMSEARHSLSAKDHLSRTLSAVSSSAMIDTDAGLNVPRILGHVFLRTVPSLLAQRTVILRI